MALSAGDLGTLVGLLERLYAVEAVEVFPARVVEAMRALLPGVLHGYNEVATDTGRVVATILPSDVVTPTHLEVLSASLDQHPIIAYQAATGDGSPHTISDFVSREAFQRMAIYQDLYRQIDTEDQLAFSLISPGLIVGMAVGRDRWQFTERERVLAALLRPHIVAAHRHAVEHTLARQVAEALDVSVVRLGHDWRIAVADDRARRWLAACFERWPARSRRLPAPLVDWLRVQLRQLESDPSLPLQPLVVEGSGIRVSVRYVPSTPTDGPVLVVRGHETAPAASLERRYGLSPREVEVVRLLAGGASSRTIAERLIISIHTVNRHLQNVYAKLGVNTRTAAIAKLRTIAPDL